MMKKSRFLSALLIEETLLKSITDNKELFLQKKEQLFMSIYDMAYPSELECENNYRSVLSPAAITDENCFVFVVRNNDMIRIIGSSEHEYDSDESHHTLDNAVISEVTLKKYEIDDIINHLIPQNSKRCSNSKKGTDPAVTMTECKS